MVTPSIFVVGQIVVVDMPKNVLRFREGNISLQLIFEEPIEYRAFRQGSGETSDD